MTPTRPPRHLLASCTLTIAAAAAQAAPPKKEGTLGGGKGGGPIMSMADLRACVARQARVDTKSDEAVKAQEQLKAERAAIDEASAALKAELDTIDRTNRELLEDYVARSQAHDIYEWVASLQETLVRALPV